MYTFVLGDNLSWDIKPSYLFSLSAQENYEEKDFDVNDISVSGWLLGQSLVFGLDTGLKFSVNLDYMIGKYSEVPTSSMLEKDDSYSSFVLGGWHEI